ncbi:hypothetical protein N9R50_01550 [bacterium]|jgi:hypothetical protein|nr:hypothetical protein [bacterium]
MFEVTQVEPKHRHQYRQEVADAQVAAYARDHNVREADPLEGSWGIGFHQRSREMVLIGHAIGKA